MEAEVVIIGAGIAGLGAAIALEQAGIQDYVILERERTLGGTWRDNIYPGVACDVPALLYEYPGEPNHEWSKLYAPGSEILAYLEQCSEKYGLTRHTRTSVEVERMWFDASTDRWHVCTKADGEVSARFVVLATGVFGIPSVPPLPGLDTFEGPVFHTARWQEDEPLAGRRVGIVGTGASALQLVPILAEEASELTVFQRTPIWVLPRWNPGFSERWRRMFRRVPWTQDALRSVVAGGFGAFIGAVWLRHARYPWATRGVERLGRWHLRRQVADEEVRGRLEPGYGWGCKRPAFSNEYYRAFARPNVRLVAEAVTTIEPEGVRLQDGDLVPLDALVLATGFKVFAADSAPPFPILGLDDVSLGDYWQTNRFQAFEGTSVPGFPNLFLLPGPYATTVINYHQMVRAGSTHLRRCVQEAIARSATRIEVRQAPHDAYLADMLERREQIVLFGNGCSSVGSYYFDERGDAPFFRPDSDRNVIHRSETFPMDDYEFSNIESLVEEQV
jgi:cation diffusion facilitator CzcD-associated flavoprotein CzcO